MYSDDEQEAEFAAALSRMVREGLIFLACVIALVGLVFWYYQ